MNNKRIWNILNWNIRGINAETKWLALRQKIEESAAGIICFQETKREGFDLSYVHNFCPHRFTKFEYLPSVGASGGIIIIWVGSLLHGEVLF